MSVPLSYHLYSAPTNSVTTKTRQKHDTRLGCSHCARDLHAHIKIAVVVRAKPRCIHGHLRVCIESKTSAWLTPGRVSAIRTEWQVAV